MVRLLFYVFLFSVSLAAGNRIVGYSCGTDPQSTSFDFSRLTHIIGSFVYSTADGSLTFQDWIPEDKIVQVLKKAESQGAVPMIALGTTEDGWTMTKSKASRTKFISNIISFCQTNGIKGIDLDLEGFAQEFSGGSPATFFPMPYESLAVELRAALPSGMLLTSAIGATSYNGAQWTDKFLGALDWVNVMVYDLALTWAASPVKNHSTYDNHTSAAQYWNGTRKIAKEKIMLGVPFYSRGWDRDNNCIYRESAGWDVTTWDYKDIIFRKEVPRDQDTLNFTAAETILYPRAPGITGKGTLFFNNQSIMARKVQWTKDNGYRGIMIWQIGQDVPTSHSRSLLRVIDSVYNSGTTALADDIKTGEVYDLTVTNNVVRITGLHDNVRYTIGVFTSDGKCVHSQVLTGSRGSAIVCFADTRKAGGVLILRIAHGKEASSHVVPVLGRY